MPTGRSAIPKPANEPILGYLKGSPERIELEAKLKEMRSEVIEVPIIINGKDVKTGDFGESVIPHEHGHVLAKYHRAGADEIDAAIAGCVEAQAEWADMPSTERLSIFLKMGELLAGPWRQTINASTILGQSKNFLQAEIDSACELIDFYRFNPYYAQEIYANQPGSNPGVFNRVHYRPLEGFIYAITPFNFTSIAGNLPTSPAMMGNVCLWKPARYAIPSAYYLMRMFQEAGLPPGVINFVPGMPQLITDKCLDSPDFAGIHYTGSTWVFQQIWKKIGENIERYKSYPRIVGETGGKDFVFAHESADVRELTTALVRGGFEYAGQKCSAASRTYIPSNIWPAVKENLLADLKTVKTGNPEQHDVLVNAVIHKRSFDNAAKYISFAKEDPTCEVIAGGNCDDSVGYFIDPTVVVTTDPSNKMLCDEIFAPILTVHVYDPAKYEETLRLCDSTSEYALTGSIFGRDRMAVNKAMKILVNASGNFYINDKPTGAVVGQQPFGGGRASGTNDKAGSFLNLIRWVSTRTIKENFVPPQHFSYPYMNE